MVHIIEIENHSSRPANNSLPSVSPAEIRDHRSLSNDFKTRGNSVNQEVQSHAFRHNNTRNDSNKRDRQDSAHVTDGDAIISKYGTTNVGFEEGISFSYAASAFYSSVAQAGDTTGKKMASSPSFVSTNQVNDRQMQKNIRPHGNSTISNQSIVNPYVKRVQKNISKSSQCNRSTSPNSDLHFNPACQRTGGNTRNIQNMNHKSCTIPMSKSASMSSSMLGGVDIDFGDGFYRHEDQQKNTDYKAMSSHKQSEQDASSHRLRCHELPDQYNNSPKWQVAMKDVPFDVPTFDAIQYQPKVIPIVQELNMKTRPKTFRKTLQINHLFSSPVSNFWSNKYKSFNHMQSELSDVLVNSDENVVVSAPTGAGKTAVFEMAIGRLLRFGQEERTINMEDKIVYISPSKALCDERFNDWSQCLIRVNSNLKCVVATGDRPGSSSNCSSLQELSESTLILTTPEKWDSITRNWTDNLTFLASVKLLLIDEVHLLGDENRGGCLESVICRMKTIQRAIWTSLNTSKQSNVVSTAAAAGEVRRCVPSKTLRIVSLSATLPNIEDIAYFIEARAVYRFDSSYRPVPLITHVIGLGYSGKNQFMFDKNMGKEIPGLLRRFSNGKPAIVFCHTKKQTETLAQELTSTYGSSNPDVIKLSRQTNLSPLRKCMEHGIAYHHSAMDSECRQLVEKAFLSGMVKCLCATSTLAMGVNLPAHLVIVKGTKVWRGSSDGYQDIDSGTLLQMIGRAGRAGFDENGTAIILTDKKSKASVERFTSGIDIVESKLLKNLIETLNTEIYQRVISDIETAIRWLMDSYLCVRVHKNPQRYGVAGHSTDVEIKEYLTRMCMESIHDLHQNGVISISSGKVQKIEPLKACQIMSRHLVSFSAMKLIMSLSCNSNDLQILHMLSKLEGLHYPVRKAEKSKLNAAHKIVKYKFDTSSKFRIQTSEQKAFVLLQCAIGQHYLDDYTLRQEMSLSVEFASRMLLAAEDYCKEDSKHGQVVFECMVMRRCMATSLWSSNDGVLNQIVGVGQATTAKLLLSGIKTFDDVISKGGSEIEEACGREPPFGQELRVAVSKLYAARLQVKADLKKYDKMISVLTCDLSFYDDSLISDTASENIVKYSLIVYTDRPGGLISFESDIVRPGVYTINCPSDMCRLHVRLISNVVGLDSFINIGGEDLDECSRVSLTPVKRRNRKLEANTSSKNLIDFSPPTSEDSDLAVGNTIQPNSSSDFQDKKEEEKAKSHGNIVTPSPCLTRSSLVTNKGVDTFVKKNNSSILRGNQRGKTTCTRHGMKNVWQRQRKELQKSQQRAFSSQKENPFSSFQYDPNDCEKQLVESIEQASTLRDNNQAKNFLNDYKNQNFQRQPFKRSVAFSKGWNFAGQSNKRYKSVSSGRSMRLQDLLQQKAQEQEAYTKELINYRLASQEQSYHLNVPQPSYHRQSRLSSEIPKPYFHHQPSLWHMQKPELTHEFEPNNCTIIGLHAASQTEKQLFECMNVPVHDSQYVRCDKTNNFQPNVMVRDDLARGNLKDCELLPHSSGVFHEDVTPQGMVITVKSDAINDSKHSAFDEAFIL